MAQRGFALGIQGLGLIQPIAHPWIGAPGVQHAFDGGHFFATLGGRATGHHGFLIPAQAPSNLAQSLGFTLKCHQVVKSSHRKLLS